MTQLPKRSSLCKPFYCSALLGVQVLTLVACQNTTTNLSVPQANTPIPASIPVPGSEPKASEPPIPKEVIPEFNPLPSPDLPTPGAVPSTAPAPALLEARPEAPLNLRVVENATDAITLLWDFDAGQPVSYNLYLNNQQVVSKHTSPNYYRFSQLESGTTYTLGISATNTAGESEQTKVTTSTTRRGRTASGNFSGGGSGNTTISPTPVATPIPPNLFEAERQINTVSTGGQENPAIAMNTAGDFVVVWESGADFTVATSGPALNTQDGSGKGIFAQRYNSAGEKVGSEFRVNTYTEDDQSQPCVAMDDAGNFTVAWQSKGQSGNSGQTDIYAQRYNAEGIAQGSAFLVNSDLNTHSSQKPTIAMLGNGNFLIAWEDLSRSLDILVQRYEANGTAIESPISIGVSNRIEIHPQLSVNTNGKVLLSYNQQNLAGTNRANYSLFPFDTPTDTISVSISSSNEIHPVGVPSEGGGFVLFYESGGSGNRRIMARTIGETGNISSAFEVVPAQDLSNFTAMGTSTGQIIVSWQSRQNDQYDIFARRYASVEDIKKFSDIFQINTYQTNQQQNPGTSITPDGKFVVIWDGEGTDESSGVFGKAFTASDNPLIEPE